MTLNSPLLEVKDLQVSINDNIILNNLNLKINKGEIHAIMGPNGSGKSTILDALTFVLFGKYFKGVNKNKILI